MQVPRSGPYPQRGPPPQYGYFPQAYGYDGNRVLTKAAVDPCNAFFSSSKPNIGISTEERRFGMVFLYFGVANLIFGLMPDSSELPPKLIQKRGLFVWRKSLICLDY